MTKKMFSQYCHTCDYCGKYIKKFETYYLDYSLGFKKVEKHEYCMFCNEMIFTD